MRSCIIIANRGAGSFSQKRLDRICSTIEKGGLTIEQRLCSDFSEITEIASAASKLTEKPIVVAAGGDGTINAVLNGLAGNSATCAILPMGTANVLAIELALKSPEHAASRLIDGTPRPFTAGLIQNSVQSSRFFLMAGTGFDGHVVRGVSRKEKQLLGKGAYVLSALRSFVSWDKSSIHVITDTEELTCNSLIVCNATHYGGSFCLAPGASIFTPTLEVVAIKGNSRMLSVRAAAEILLRSANPEQIVRTSAKIIKVQCAKPVQTDGDDWGDAPVEMAAEPDYAKIIM